MRTSNLGKWMIVLVFSGLFGCGSAPSAVPLNQDIKGADGLNAGDHVATVDSGTGDHLVPRDSLDEDRSYFDTGIQPEIGIPLDTVQPEDTASPTDCSPYVLGLAEAPSQYVQVISPADSCLSTQPLQTPCTRDGDCPVLRDQAEGSGQCVMGNCVDCWADDQCDRLAGEICRGGRCGKIDRSQCPAVPPCDGSTCQLLDVSEVPCTICLCGSDPAPLTCALDSDCLMISSVPYQACINGICAQCRNDEDCNWGKCVLPGICTSTEPEVHRLFGAWVIGWYGGMNHIGYLRFEPDGTLRRAMGVEDPATVYDFPPIYCEDGTSAEELIGLWSVEEVESGLLVVRMSLSLPCTLPESWTGRYMVKLDSDSGTFTSVENPNLILEAWRIPMDICNPQFTRCDGPPWI